MKQSGGGLYDRRLQLHMEGLCSPWRCKLAPPYYVMPWSKPHQLGLLGVQPHTTIKSLDAFGQTGCGLLTYPQDGGACVEVSTWCSRSLFGWPVCAGPIPCMVARSCVPRHLVICWSSAPGLLPVTAASPSMDHEHGTVCQLNSEHQRRLCAPSSIISRPTCFSSSLLAGGFSTVRPAPLTV